MPSALALPLTFLEDEDEDDPAGGRDCFVSERAKTEEASWTC